MEECPVSRQFMQAPCLGLVWWALLVGVVGPRGLAGKHGKVQWEDCNIYLLKQ